MIKHLKKRRRAKLPAGWMGKTGRVWLAAQAARASQIIEVGCWLGRSTKVLAAATRGKVWAVDHWQGTPGDPSQHERLYAPLLATRNAYAEFCRNLKREITAAKVIPVQMPSAEAALMLRDRMGRVFDFVFIDGDHSYQGCCADIQAYYPLLKAGGLLAGHDYHWDSVRQAVADRLGNHTIDLGPSSIWSTRV